MKRMAIIAPSDSPIPAVCGGAVETLTTNLIEENEKDPHFIIDVYCAKNKKLDKISYNNCTIIQVDKPFYYIIIKLYTSVYNKIASFLRIDRAVFYFDSILAKAVRYSEDYDYILIENNMNTFESVIKYATSKEKIIFHLHNDVVDSPYKSERLCNLVYKNSYRILCASGYLYDRYLVAIKEDCEKKVKLFQNCIDFNLYSLADQEKIEAVKNTYHIKDDCFLIMFSGRFSPEKGVKELVRAVAEIDKTLNIQCIIAGGNWFGTRKEKKYVDEINKIIESSSRFIKLGYVSSRDMPLFYQMSDLVVVPSKWQEPFGMVALEALTMGCPIAVTNKGGLKMIPDSTCGDIIDEGDNLEDGIKKVIIKNITRSDSERKERKRNAYKIAREKFYGTDEYFKNFLKDIEYEE